MSTAYEQYFNKQDAAGITSLFAKNYLRVTPMGIVDNTKYYEGAFKAGMNHLEIRTTDVQLLSENMAMRTGEARVTGKSEKGDPLELNAFWTSLDVRENGQWKIRMLTSMPKAPPQPQEEAAKKPEASANFGAATAAPHSVLQLRGSLWPVAWVSAGLIPGCAALPMRATARRRPECAGSLNGSPADLSVCSSVTEPVRPATAFIV
ncbi:nuclear transport factor 2 family protein [Bradyrhizobium sp. USDA 4508]